MNVTIDKTTAEVAHMVEHGVMVTDGDWHAGAGAHRGVEPMLLVEQPADLVALTKPCGMCEGTGIDPEPEYDQSDDCLLSDMDTDGWREVFPCPDCDGRGFPPLIVQTKCEHPYHDTSRLDGGWGVCVPGACTDGYVTTEFKVTDVLPIVATLPEAPTEPCVEVVEHGKPGRVTLLHFRDAGRMRSRFITLPPDARPGQYAVIVEVAR